MERSNLIIAVLFMTAFASSPCFGQQVIASVEISQTQEVLEPETEQAIAPLATAARHLRSGTILRDADIIIDGATPDAVAFLKQTMTGKEIKRTIYAGKPLTLSDLGSPTVIKRNAVITIEFYSRPPRHHHRRSGAGPWRCR